MYYVYHMKLSVFDLKHSFVKHENYDIYICTYNSYVFVPLA